MLEKILSGGQTGADQAAWRAARSFGLPTGGWMPLGFLTEASSGSANPGVGAGDLAGGGSSWGAGGD
jgi:hypothetical protein